jgi:hypothetical protein
VDESVKIKDSLNVKNVGIPLGYGIILIRGVDIGKSTEKT